MGAGEFGCTYAAQSCSPVAVVVEAPRADPPAAAVVADAPAAVAVEQQEPRLVSARTAVVALLAARLSRAADARDEAVRSGALRSSYEALTTFHALEAPAISIADYVARVAKYAYCSPAALLSAVLYMDRAAARDPRLAVSGLSCHRLFMTAVVLAAKFHDDVSYNLDYYGKVGGLPVPELAALEVTMLKTLDFRLSVHVDEFAELEHYLVAEVHALIPPAAPPTSCPLVAVAVAECAQAGLTPPAPCSVNESHPSAPAKGLSQLSPPYASKARDLRHAALLRVASTASFMSAVTAEESTSSTNSNCTSPHLQSPISSGWDEHRHES